MSDDRLAQARGEAERQFPDGTWMAREQDRIIFTKGWHAADANPQPHTITRARLDETAAKVSERFGGIQSPGALRILFAVALADLGIEVEDDDE